MDSIDNKIFNSLKKCGRGTIAFPSDFTILAEHKTVLKSLERLTDSGAIMRIARGVYCYPKQDKLLGIEALHPSYEEIAESIAKRDKARIAPAGAYAMNVLGVSTQVPMNVVFLTDGTPRKINLLNGHTITFNKAVPKNFAFQSKFAQLLTLALRAIGKDNITPEQKETIAKRLSKVPEQSIAGDYKLMPAWIRTLIKQIYDQLL